MTIAADVAAALDTEAAELGWSRARLVSVLPDLCRIVQVRDVLRMMVKNPT